MWRVTGGKTGPASSPQHRAAPKHARENEQVSPWGTCSAQPWAPREAWVPTCPSPVSLLGYGETRDPHPPVMGPEADAYWGAGWTEMHILQPGLDSSGPCWLREYSRPSNDCTVLKVWSGVGGVPEAPDILSGHLRGQPTLVIILPTFICSRVHAAQSPLIRFRSQWYKASHFVLLLEIIFSIPSL